MSFQIYNVKNYGAKGDLVTKQLTLTISTNTLTVSGTGSPNTFTAGQDEGKMIAIFGAGNAGGIHFSTITSVTSGTVVVIANNVITALAGVSAVFHFGTDDAPALQRLHDLIPALDTNQSRMVLLPGGTMYFPPGRYYLGSTVNIVNLGIALQGPGGHTGSFNTVPSTPGLPSAYGGGARLCTNKAIDMVVVGSLASSPKTQQAGTQIRDLHFEDISGANLATGLRINAQTRWVVWNSSFQLLNYGMQVDTNGGDTSWSLIHKCSFGLCNKGVYGCNTNTLGLGNTGTGGAFHLDDGDLGVNPGQIGIHLAGGNGNIKITKPKIDLHGSNTVGIQVDGGVGITIIAPSFEVKTPDASTVPINITGSMNGTSVGGNTIATRVMIVTPYIFNDDTIVDGCTGIKILNGTGSTSSPTHACQVLGGDLSRFNVGVEVGSGVFGTKIADIHAHDFAGTSPVAVQVDSGAIATVIRDPMWGRGPTVTPTPISDSGTNTSIGFTDLKPQTTSGRPAATTVNVGVSYFDTTLNKPVWSDGTNWRDASNTIV